MKSEEVNAITYENVDQGANFQQINVQEHAPQTYTTQNTILTSIPIQDSSMDTSIDDLTMEDDEDADETYNPVKNSNSLRPNKVAKISQQQPLKQNITALQAYNASRRKKKLCSKIIKIESIENNDAFKSVLTRKSRRSFPKQYPGEVTFTQNIPNKDSEELQIIKNSCFISPTLFEILTRVNPFEFLSNMPKFVQPENQQSVLDQLKQLYLVNVDKIRTKVKKSKSLFSLSCDKLFVLNNRTVIVLFLHGHDFSFFLQMLYFEEYKEIDIQKLVGESLKNFNISFDQIVGITTGSCPVLKEFSLLTGSGHQTCLRSLIDETAKSLFSNKTGNHVDYDDENQLTDENMHINSPLLTIIRKIDQAITVINSTHSGRTLFEVKTSFIGSLNEGRWDLLVLAMDRLISIQNELDAYVSYPQMAESKFSPSEIKLIEDIMFLFRVLNHVNAQMEDSDCSPLYFTRFLKILATLDSSDLSVKFLTELMGRFCADESYCLIANVLEKLGSSSIKRPFTQRQNALLTNINIKLATKQNLTADQVLIKKSPKEFIFAPHREVESGSYESPYWLISKPGFYSETWTKRQPEIVQCLKLIRPSISTFVQEIRENADKINDQIYYVSENYLESILFLKFNLNKN